MSTKEIIPVASPNHPNQDPREAPIQALDPEKKARFVEWLSRSASKDSDSVSVKSESDTSTPISGQENPTQ